MKKVAVSADLANVKQELKQAGYQVVELSGNNWQDASAVVVSGMDDNMMNIQTTLTKGQVIDASGKTPQEIINQLK